MGPAEPTRAHPNGTQLATAVSGTLFRRVEMSPKVAMQPATRSTSGPSMTGLPLVLPARAYRLTGVMPLIVPIAGMTPVVDPSAFVAPTAAVLGNAEIDARASIFHGASVRADSAAIRIGRETNVQDNAVLHADPDAPCTVGDRVTIGHGAVVHGCIIEDDCLIGMNATVLNHAVVGTGSLVAAGSVVLAGCISRRVPWWRGYPRRSSHHPRRGSRSTAATTSEVPRSRHQ